MMEINDKRAQQQIGTLKGKGGSLSRPKTKGKILQTNRSWGVTHPRHIPLYHKL